jgi:RNA polymerase sigma factor (sigma-70 family)
MRLNVSGTDLAYRTTLRSYNQIQKIMTVLQQLSEVELIDRIVRADAALFEVLMRRYNPYLYKVGRSYGYCHQDVEDLMQETFIHAYENLRTLNHRQYFKTWLIRIMLNECYRRNRKASSHREIAADTFSSEKSIPMFSGNNDEDTERKVSNRELNGVIETAIQRIPVDYRIVFSLRELNGLSVHETADTLNISETNVKVRLNRAKAMLRKEVEKMYTAEDIFQFNLIYCDNIVNKVMARIQGRD